MATLSGSNSLMRKLQEIAKSMGGGEVSVGFMEGATYPDGTPVAAVAYWNEFGKPGQPPRPFFRGMIAKDAPGWPLKMAKAAKFTKYNGAKTLAFMGEDIQGALSQSITDFTTPALSPVTIERKGFDKPLIDTGHMQRSITYEVKT